MYVLRALPEGVDKLSWTAEEYCALRVTTRSSYTKSLSFLTMSESSRKIKQQHEVVLPIELLKGFEET